MPRNHSGSGSKHLPRLLAILLVLALIGLWTANAGASAMRPRATAARFLPRWPQDYAGSPCSAKNAAGWIKHVVEDPYNYSYYANAAFCALPITEACLAQQYNRAHNRHVAFYTSQTFYRRCKTAYAQLRAQRHARPAHWSACDIVGWASILAGPFIPVESLAVKAGTIVFGSALKLKCG